MSFQSGGDQEAQSNQESGLALKIQQTAASPATASSSDSGWLCLLSGGQWWSVVWTGRRWPI